MIKKKTPTIKNPSPNPYARRIMVSVRFNQEEMRKLLAGATKHTGGNVSDYIRWIALAATKSINRKRK